MPRLKAAALPRDDEDNDASNRDGTFVQRVVSANDKPPPATTAVNSVFGQAAPGKPGRKAGAVVTPIDVDAVEIRRGVPLPPSVTGSGGVSASAMLLSKMAKGDSVVLAGPQARTLVSTASKLGIKAQLRSLKHDAAAVAKHGEDVVGVWRMS